MKKNRIISLILVLALCLTALPMTALAGGREFAFELMVNYTLDYEGYDPYTYSAYIRNNYDVEEFYGHPNFRDFEAAFIEVSDPWFNALFDTVRAAQNVLLPRPTPSEWIELDPGFVFTLADGSTINMHTWDSSTGVIISEELISTYGGEESIPAIVSVVSVPELPGYTIASTQVSNGTVTIRVNPNEGYTAPDYSVVHVPLAKLDGTVSEPPAEVEITPPATSEAKPTSSTVLINGVNVAFEAYEIDGYNYFKLRDLAFALNGSEKQFEVVWNEQRGAIDMSSGRAYTVVGGEMLGKGDGVKTPKPTSALIFLDGTEVFLTAYNIENNNYFKLRDVGDVFDFGVFWDEVNQTIVIDTSIGYTAP